MECRQRLSASTKFVDRCLKEAQISREEIHLVIPHQASRALGVIMPKLGFSKDKYIDRVAQYGNMVSASVPFENAAAAPVCTCPPRQSF